MASPVDIENETKEIIRQLTPPTRQGVLNLAFRSEYGSEGKDNCKVYLGAALKEMKAKCGKINFSCLPGPRGADFALAHLCGLTRDEIWGFEYDSKVRARLYNFEKITKRLDPKLADCIAGQLYHGSIIDFDKYKDPNIKFHVSDLDFCGWWASEIKESFTRTVDNRLQDYGYLFLTLQFTRRKWRTTYKDMEFNPNLTEGWKDNTLKVAQEAEAIARRAGYKLTPVEAHAAYQGRDYRVGLSHMFHYGWRFERIGQKEEESTQLTSSFPLQWNLKDRSLRDYGYKR